MCLSIFLRRGAAASATIYPCVECASSRSVFYCITLYRNELSYATIECTLCEYSIVMNKNVDPARLQDGRAGFLGKRNCQAALEGLTGGFLNKKENWI